MGHSEVRLDECRSPHQHSTMKLNIETEELDEVFAALAHPHRREIVATLADGRESTVSDLVDRFEVSFNQVSKHLKTLERAGLIKRRKSGREYHLSLDPRPLFEARTWMETYEKFWRQSLKGLGKFLDEKHKGSNK